MAQHDYSIANQGFPATRADLNNALSAIATNNSGTTAPATQFAGQFWIDTTTSTWTLYIHDGTDDIQFATIDTSANTVNFTDSALDVVTDTTPQLGGDLDSNGNNILFDDGTGINDDDDNELIRFQKIASAVNQIDISNSATGNAPEISATGDDTNIDLKFTTKGTGNVISNSNILFDTASKGIYLGVTTPTASNLLDDYEEGTWTPSFQPGSGSFTSVTDGSLVAAKYTKIGDVCFISCFYRTNAITKGAASGNVFLAGLPFTAADSLSAFTIAFSSDFSGDQPSCALSSSNNTYINLYYRTVANGTPSSLNVTNLGTGNNDNNIYISGVYKVV